MQQVIQKRERRYSHFDDGSSIGFVPSALSEIDGVAHAIAVPSRGIEQNLIWVLLENGDLVSVNGVGESTLFQYSVPGWEWAKSYDLAFVEAANGSAELLMGHRDGVLVLSGRQTKGGYAMWILMHLWMFIRSLAVLTMLVLWWQVAQHPQHPALAAEATSASVDGEAKTISQVSWNPPACNFPAGSGAELLEITHLEVTQGVQTPDNELPLIAGRATAVLAHISTVDPATQTISGVMTVTDANGEIISSGPVPRCLLMKRQTGCMLYLFLNHLRFRLDRQ